MIERYEFRYLDKRLQYRYWVAKAQGGSECSDWLDVPTVTPEPKPKGFDYQPKSSDGVSIKCIHNVIWNHCAQCSIAKPTDLPDSAKHGEGKKKVDWQAFYNLLKDHTEMMTNFMESIPDETFEKIFNTPRPKEQTIEEELQEHFSESEPCGWIETAQAAIYFLKSKGWKPTEHFGGKKV